MKQHSGYPVALCGLFVVIGIVFPFFTGHMFGIPGVILLPMHLPVLFCGLLLGPRWGALCGGLVPVLSSLLTGMPALYPMMPIMAAQLLALGLVSGLLYQTVRFPLYLSLGLVVGAGWLVYGLLFYLLFFAGNGALKAPTLWVALMRGVPGIFIQLLLIPLLMKRVERRGERKKGSEESAFSKALDCIRRREASVVILQNGNIVHMASGRGVRPLLTIYREAPEKLRGALVLDKIIGKAAAMILTQGGVREVYAEVMTAAAVEFLRTHNVELRDGQVIDVLSNRERDGICPVERSVLRTEDPEEGIRRITEELSKLVDTEDAG